MDKREDSNLEPWQIEDAARLFDLYKKYRSGGGLNQAEFARAFGLKSQGNVGHYLHGRSPLNIAQATNFAAGLGCAIADFSPRLAQAAAEAGAVALTDSEAKKRPEHPMPAVNVISLHPDDPLPEGFIYIKESTIAFSGGNGRTPHIELVEESLPAAYATSWFQHKRINPATVRRYKVADHSMEPFLFDGDTVLVNHAETSVKDGKVYAFRYGDDLRVKQLFQRLDGTLILHSINPAFKDEEVSPELVHEHICIIGRVRDKSGSGGL